MKTSRCYHSIIETLKTFSTINTLIKQTPFSLEKKEIKDSSIVGQFKLH